MLLYFSEMSDRLLKHLKLVEFYPGGIANNQICFISI